MHYRRGWIVLLLFSLTLINYVDRIALSFAAAPISQEFGLSPVALGYLFSSLLWTYAVCLIPMGVFVDRFGAKGVAALGIGIWSLATVVTGAAWSVSSLLATRLVMGAGDVIAAFDIHAATGALSLREGSVPTGSPMCIVSGGD